jgi:hypothetical protein
MNFNGLKNAKEAAEKEALELKKKVDVVEL